MSIKVYGLDGNPFDQNSIEPCAGRFLRALCRLIFSGNYVAGGDTLDLTNGGTAAVAAAPSVVPVLESRGLASIDLRPLSTVAATAISSTFGEYRIIIPAAGVVPVPFASLNALKVKIYVGAGTEYTVGAYGADVLDDVVQAELIWAR